MGLLKVQCTNLSLRSLLTNFFSCCLNTALDNMSEEIPSDPVRGVAEIENHGPAADQAMSIISLTKSPAFVAW